MKKLCLIAYRFPPMPGVGAKRWAKFSKHLAERGFIVHVITADYFNPTSISWSKDVDHENIIVHRLSSKLPKAILYGKPDFISKIVKRLWQNYKKYYTHFFDDAEPWAISIVEYVEELIMKESISTLFVTGAPFSQLVSAAIVKRDISNLRLIVDYRDAWNFLSTYQYKNKLFRNISDKRSSIDNEYLVMTAADELSFVTKGLKDLYEKQYPQFKNKMSCIYSGYEKLPVASDSIQDKKGNGVIIYPGNLGFSRLSNLEKVACAIDKLNKIYSDLPYKLIVFTDFSVPFNSNYECLIVKKRVGVESIQTEIKKSDFCLSINADEFDYAVSAKVFDYMANGKKIIHISKGGELSEYLSSKKQVVINSAKFNEYLPGLERIYTDDIEAPDYSEMKIEKSIDQLEVLIGSK